MYDGRIVGTVTPDIAREEIGLMMAGAHDPAEQRAQPHERRRQDAQSAPPRSAADAAARGRSRTARRPSRGRAGCPTVKITVAAIVLALVIGARPDRRLRRRRDRVAALLLRLPVGLLRARPATRSATSYCGAAHAARSGSPHAISATLERAAPLICAGLGVTLAFRAGLFNIGAQGQLIIGALVAGVRRLHLGPAARACTCWSRSSPACSAARSGAASPACSRRDRRARGDHHDHAQLPRRVAAALLR